MMEKLKQRLKETLVKDYDNAENNESYNDYTGRKRLMRFNRFFSEYRVFTAVYVTGALVLFVMLLTVLNDLQSGSLLEILTGEEQEKGVSILETLFSNWFIIFVFIVVAVLGYFKFAYQVRTSFGSINVGQKGTARWATREEIDAEYKKIPEKITPFPGMGGVPIARDGDMLYIDDSNTNTLVLGMTRSGKDQIETDGFIENISRAEEKCSFLCGDPKMESARKSIPMLQERGYETYVFNLIDPVFSMRYNPLTMIIDEYKMGDHAAAQELLLSLGTQIFAPDPNERDPYWKDSARKVFVAAIWAEIEDNLAMDRAENDRRRAAHEKKENERKKAYYKELYGKDYELYRKAALVRKILKNMPDMSDAELIDEFNELCRLKGVSMKLTKRNIEKVKNFAFKNAAFIHEKYFPVETNERKISIYSTVKMCITLSAENFNKNQDMLDFYFISRPEDDFARITYGAIADIPKQTKGTIMSMFEKEVQIFMLDNIAKMTAESEIKFEEIFFQEKPVAIFYALPDYDEAFYFLATIFISQMYYAAAKLATAMPGGKLPRRFHFWLNEVCNLPKIENLSTMSTVCLGRNIILHLLIQSYGQLESVYGEGDAQTLRDNCGNEIYIKAASEETSEKISKKLGNETQIVVNRTGRKLSINKELTEMGEEMPLLTPYELTHVELGETIVMRTMKREDKAGNYTKGHPIKNFGEHRMKLSYQYLDDIMPQDQIFYRSPHMDRIIRANERYRDMELKLVDVGIKRITDIDIKKRSRSGGEYIRHIRWRMCRFKAGSGHGMKPFETNRMNEVFNLLNLSQQQRELYMKAGTENDKGEIIMPELALLNGHIEEHAKKLIRYRDKEIAYRGYRLLDILRPLPEKEKSREEREHDMKIEEFISNLGEEADDADTE